MDSYKQLSDALDANDQDKCLATIERHPDLAQRRFLSHRRQCGHSAPLLLHAAELGMNELLSKLISLGVNVNAYGGNGATALHFAIAVRDPIATRALIAAGANVEAKDSFWGNTPLGWTASADAFACAKILIEANATASIQSSRGYTPLALARVHDRTDLVELLESIDAPAQMQPPALSPIVPTTELPSNLALHLAVREGKPVDLCKHSIQLDGKVASTAGRNGGSAIKFDGGCLRIPHHSDFNAAGGITLSTWLRLDTWEENENAIISKGRWEREECPWEISLVPDWWISFHCYGELAHERCQFQCPNHDQWHHVAAVWDGNYQRLYIDGDEKIVVRVNEQPKDNSVPVTIGQRASDPDCYPIPLFATLEDLMLFSRPLSSEEIANVMGYVGNQAT